MTVSSEIWNCERTRLFALKKLLQSKNVIFPLVTPDECPQVMHVLMELLFPADLKIYLNPGYYASKYTLPPPTPLKHQIGISNEAPESPETGNQLKSESKIHHRKVENSRRQYVATQQNQRFMEQNYVQLPKNGKGIGNFTDSINTYEYSDDVQENASTQYQNFGNQVSRVVPLPKYCEKSGRIGDIAKFYSSPKAKYTGKASDHHSLRRISASITVNAE